ncbi:hypothetical protein NQZ68_014138 [Dissostichus eleginoides]|nr:hypothetical protein NQZ68_014138 [Dissostichus eleginoides]
MIQNKEKGLVLKEELELIQELMDNHKKMDELVSRQRKRSITSSKEMPRKKSRKNMKTSPYLSKLLPSAPGVGALIVNDTKAAAYAIGSDTEQFDGSDWGVGMTVIRQLSGGKKPC